MNNKLSTIILNDIFINDFQFKIHFKMNDNQSFDKEYSDKSCTPAAY